MSIEATEIPQRVPPAEPDEKKVIQVREVQIPERIRAAIDRALKFGKDAAAMPWDAAESR